MKFQDICGDGRALLISATANVFKGSSYAFDSSFAALRMHDERYEHDTLIFRLSESANNWRLTY